MSHINKNNRFSLKLGLALFLFFWLNHPAFAVQLNVGPGEHFIKPSVAKDGDTISIQSGVYRDCAVWTANHLSDCPQNSINFFLIAHKNKKFSQRFLGYFADMALDHVILTSMMKMLWKG